MQKIEEEILTGCWMEGLSPRAHSRHEFLARDFETRLCLGSLPGQTFSRAGAIPERFEFSDQFRINFCDILW